MTDGTANLAISTHAGETHRKVHLHFTPTYSSWLDQVELWFSKIERDVTARGVFTSVSDLKRKLMRYIRQYNKAPRTVKWKYADPSRHIGTRLGGPSSIKRPQAVVTKDKAAK